jgi:hypothetical protein
MGIGHTAMFPLLANSNSLRGSQLEYQASRSGAAWLVAALAPESGSRTADMLYFSVIMMINPSESMAWLTE